MELEKRDKSFEYKFNVMLIHRLFFFLCDEARYSFIIDNHQTYLCRAAGIAFTFVKKF